jgi:hypothetical protein
MAQYHPTLPKTSSEDDMTCPPAGRESFEKGNLPHFASNAYVFFQEVSLINNYP